MKVIHIAAEMTKIAKVGGLGDVVESLTKALEEKKISATVILPKYKRANLKAIKNFKLEIKDLKVFEKDKIQSNKVYSGKIGRVKIYLIEPKNSYFKKNSIYGYKNDNDRFLYFCKCALELLNLKYTKIDIVHLHDWHTAFIAPYYKLFFKKDVNIKAFALSIHNLCYQGVASIINLKNLGVEIKEIKKNRLLFDTKIKDVNLLKSGIAYVDIVIPVSKTYAKEILTKNQGYGLENFLKINKNKIRGIVNGIDTDLWDPKKDVLIPSNFDKTMTIDQILEKREENKSKLREILKLEKSALPIIASIGRIVTQKGPELIKHAIKNYKNRYQFVLLGIPYEKDITSEFNKLKNEFQYNKDISINFSHDESLCRLIYAAADFLIIPSLFEPCGLTQMIGFRYGVLPIVRKTGGLADTVFDLDENSIPKDKRNGFTFTKFSIASFDKAIKRALNFWKNKKATLNFVIKKNMKLDHSWEKSIEDYITNYKKILNSNLK